MKISIYGSDYVGLVTGTCLAEVVQHGLFQFIAVGTPPDEDGSADLQYVLALAESIAQHMDCYRIIIDKATAPVGTADKVKLTISAIYKREVSPMNLMLFPIRHF
jgi:UDP-glucose 6-dehydrogenase